MENCNIDMTYDKLLYTEMLIAKKLKTSELTSMAKIEQLLREYIDKKWEKRRVEASIKARNLTASNKSEKQIVLAINKIMNLWRKDIEKRVNRDIKAIYKLARTVAYKKAKGKIKASLAYNTPHFTNLVEKAEVLPSFSIADEQAMSALEKQNVFWIGQHYDENVSGVISETAGEVLEVSPSRRAAAMIMMNRVREGLGIVSTPGGFNGTSVQYFEALTANTTTVARVYGQVESFREAEVTRYQIVNPLDERTCKVCGHMDGKIFEVSQAQAQMEREMEAENPEDIKRLHPWLRHSQLTKISNRSGEISGRRGIDDSRALAAAGFSLPPFHFRCRCTVDVDVTSL
jgi:SPP1 gp7 family putative phage head morphogenesis protein